MQARGVAVWVKAVFPLLEQSFSGLIGFIQASADPFIFIRKDALTIIGVHVDDLMILGRNITDMRRVKDSLKL